MDLKTERWTKNQTPISHLAETGATIKHAGIYTEFRFPTGRAQGGPERAKHIFCGKSDYMYYFRTPNITTPSH